MGVSASACITTRCESHLRERAGNAYADAGIRTQTASICTQEVRKSAASGRTLYAKRAWKPCKASLRRACFAQRGEARECRPAEARGLGESLKEKTSRREAAYLLRTFSSPPEKQKQKQRQRQSTYAAGGCVSAHAGFASSASFRTSTDGDRNIAAPGANHLRTGQRISRDVADDATLSKNPHGRASTSAEGRKDRKRGSPWLLLLDAIGTGNKLRAIFPKTHCREIFSTKFRR
jgi:hypothetical protein